MELFNDKDLKKSASRVNSKFIIVFVHSNKNKTQGPVITIVSRHFSLDFPGILYF